ncbi:G-alpha-domain-containing protein [Serendipita vermifera]|nr:G-alpha-domain-containing protein [Serendipita vermifera]
MATMYAGSRMRSDSDPLNNVLHPSNETPQERQARLEQEALAKKVSDAIDEQIRKEKAEKAKRKQEVRILLLGQSESGKSTTLKQFQLLYAPSSFAVEAPAWRPIIYLNIARSIRRILEIISLGDSEDYDLDRPGTPGSPLDSPAQSRRPSITVALSEQDQARFAQIRTALAPIQKLEDQLIAQLSHPDEDSGEATQMDPMMGAGDSKAVTKGRYGKEVSVGGHGWRKALGKMGSRKGKGDHGGYIDWSLDPEDPIHILQRCANDMVALWNDAGVKTILRQRKIRLEESPGFYLNDIYRVVASDYLPSVDDVLKARLKTLGVVEHRFSLDAPMSGGLFGKANPHAHVDWVIYDVGGARNQRHVWAPFFDDVQALIFLAPISAFDQVLTEDANVNRMEDSLLLWRSVVSNKLLKNVDLILFLNKCDLLAHKIAAGVRLNAFMTSYGDRPNDFESIANYFRNKFGAMHQSYTPNPERELYIHMTSVVDTQATKKIITSVRDFLLRNALRGTNLL